VSVTTRCTPAFADQWTSMSMRSALAIGSGRFFQFSSSVRCSCLSWNSVSNEKRFLPPCWRALAWFSVSTALTSVGGAASFASIVSK